MTDALRGVRTSVAVAAVVLIVLQAFVARMYVVPSSSMEPTLHGCTGCSGDRIVVDRFTLRWRAPAAGEVVVFRGSGPWLGGAEPPTLAATLTDMARSVLTLEEPGTLTFVKRVIATPGQTIECCDRRGRVIVDGGPLEEPYLASPWGDQPAFAPVVVPPGTVWVMGDNRNDSADSRYRGPVPIGDVLGLARGIVLPLDRARLLAPGAAGAD